MKEALREKFLWIAAQALASSKCGPFLFLPHEKAALLTAQ